MSATAFSRKMKVLLVEDNQADARFLREAMKETGTERPHMVHVQRLSDALAKIDHEPFDVILLDLSLPDAEGMETITRMQERASGVPIVVLTGLDDADVAMRALRQGAQDYLIKGQGDSHLLMRSMRYAIERKRGEEALQKREEHYRSLIENALDIISILNEDGGIRYASPSVRRVLGHEPAELVGRSLFSYVHPDDVPAAQDLLSPKHDGASESVSREFRFRHKQGNWSALEAAGKHFIDEAGKPGIIINARDVSERRRAEEELRLANETLRAVIDTSPLAIYTLDRDRKLRSWNPAAERMFGWSAPEVIGQPLPTILPEEQHDTLAQFERILRGEETLRGVEARRLRKDGSTLEVSIWTSPLRSATGEAVGIMAVVVDNTERKRLEEQLRLAQRMEAVGRLAGGVAHDFNNLLTIITGYTDLLLDRMHPGEPLRRQAEEIRKAASRAAALTNQLLAFSRKHVLQPKVVDLNEVVAELERMLRRLIGEDVNLVTWLDSKGGCVKADPSQIEQVIVNLVVNAREAMPSGGRLTIETKNVYLDEDYARTHVGVKPGPYVMLAVTDTGHGIDPNTLQHIFEPFFTTKKQKGTGLGLATVYGIVKQSGGHIWVYSEVGKGSSFKIYLPRVAEPASEHEAALLPAGLARSEETILIAEDEDTVRALVREILQNKGYRVLEARHGGEALELSERYKGRIHLLVTDVVMPQMSGRELSERIHNAHPDMKVLYISGYTDNVMVPHGMLNEGAQFLQKPFAPEALARRVREMLDTEE